MTKILAIAGKKQSGKSTLGQFLSRNASELFFHQFMYDGKGTMLTADNVKVYHFADSLKELCRDYFDIPEEWLWGTDEDKNRLTQYKWEDLPHYTTLKKTVVGDSYDGEDILCRPTGFMTVREFLQEFGTGIGRRIYGNIWINKCFKKIEKDTADIAIICDIDNDNDIKYIQAKKGKIIYLMRHTDVVIASNQYDGIIDNRNIDINNRNIKCIEILRSFGWIE